MVCGGQICTFSFAVVPPVSASSLRMCPDSSTSKEGRCRTPSSSRACSVTSTQPYPCRGIVTSGATRIVSNSGVKAYFGPGEQPQGFCELIGTSDSFVVVGQLALTGYDVNLPSLGPARPRRRNSLRTRARRLYTPHGPGVESLDPGDTL